MRSHVFDSVHIKAEPTKTGERREVFDAPTATLERFASHITTLNPGEAPHPAHRHPEEELMIVKEGTLEVMLNGQPTRVEVGGMIFCASNELHGIRNVGKTPRDLLRDQVVPARHAEDRRGDAGADARAPADRHERRRAAPWHRDERRATGAARRAHRSELGSS